MFSSKCFFSHDEELDFNLNSPIKPINHNMSKPLKPIIELQNKMNES
jgi:hypothetical protein